MIQTVPVDGDLVVSVTMLRLLSMCERRVWLDHYGDSGSRDAAHPALTYRLNEGLRHEEAVHRATGVRTEAVQVSTWEEGVRLTRELMARGTAAIIGAYVERTLRLADMLGTLTIRGRIDRLERVDSAFRLGWRTTQSRPIYAPIEIKQYTHLSEPDYLQLDAYLWLLEAVQPQSVSGWFWLGKQESELPQQKVEHSLDGARLLNALRRLAVLLRGGNEPAVRLEAHCEMCHWYSGCRSTATSQLHVSILPGLSRQAKQHLQSEGITTLDQVVAMPPEALKQFKGIKTTAHAVHAQARAFIEERPVWYQALSERCLHSGVMFDLETDPYTQLPWSWGWVDAQGEAHVLITAEGRRSQVVALPDGRTVMVVSDKDTAWQVFAESVGVNGCPIYHWTGFDAGVMRATAPYHVREKLEERMHDLHRSFKQSVKFPVNGNSLKVVARYLNFEWAEYDAWDAAYWDYQRWLRHGDLEALARSCNYQTADVQALVVVWTWLVEHRADNSTL
jgi:uncharacterized protein